MEFHPREHSKNKLCKNFLTDVGTPFKCRQLNYASESEVQKQDFVSKRIHCLLFTLHFKHGMM